MAASHTGTRAPKAPRLFAWRGQRRQDTPELSVTEALAAVPETAAPAFTPRDPARATGQMPALAGEAAPAPRRQPVQAGPRAVAGPEAAVLRRVRDALQGQQYAAAFAADKRDLPLFDAVTRQQGWQGLHVPPSQRTAPQHRRWSTDRWYAAEVTLAARAADAAIDAAHAAIDAASARVHAPRHAGVTR